MSKELFLSELNDEQYAAVKVENNSVISAGAGSGKTRVLAKRFVNLIVEKNIEIEKIVALTFTKKAATEMSERIFAELSSLAKKNISPVLQKAIENFHLAQISTIDSFCASIARTGCSRFGIIPNFKIDKNASDNIADSCALNFFLKHRNEPILQTILADHSIENFVTDFFAKILKEYVLITKPLDLKLSIQHQDKRITFLFEKYMMALSKEVQEIEMLESNVSEFCDTVKNLINNLGATPKNVGDKIFEQFLQNLFDVANISIMHLKRDATTKACKESVKNIREIAPKLLTLLNFVDNKPFTLQVLDFVDELQTIFLQQKRASGVLSYSDVAQLAVDVLTQDIDIRNFYKAEIDAIMIDEFQDNNSLQRDLLFLLTENDNRTDLSIPKPEDLSPDKLFFVGDDKQSIYLFRGADVSVFRKLTKEISTDEKSVINLSTNYRSETKLLNIFNYVFKSVFYSESHIPDDDIDEKPLEHECFFSPIIAHQNTKDVNSSLKIFIADGIRFKYADSDPSNPNLDAEETEAVVLANEIKQMQNNKVMVRDSKTKLARPCQWSDFAILFRTTGKQALIERCLRKAGIPYKAVQQKGLFYDAPINDMYALLKLCVYHWDKLCYAQVLRSPFVKISDSAFTEILLHDYEPFDENIIDLLENKDVDGFIKGRELFMRVKKYIKEKTNAEIISSLWYDEAYRYLMLTNPDYHHYIELYDYLFEIARQADDAGLSVVSFLDLLEGYIVEGNKIGDMDVPDDNKSNHVQLLTIHKSKGLEYPIVCIPFCGYEGRIEKADDFVFYSDDLGLSIVSPKTEYDFYNEPAANIFFEELKLLENQKHIAETKRLLYVAMTRAESHIIMTGKRIVKGKTKNPELDFTPRPFNYLRDFFKFPKNTSAKTSFFSLLIPGLNEDDEEFKNMNIEISEIMPMPFHVSNSFLYDKTNKNKIHLTKTEIINTYNNASVKTFSEPEAKVFAASHLHEFDPINNYQNHETKKNDDTSKDESITAAELGTLTHLAIESFFKQKSISIPAKYEEPILKMRDSFLNSTLGTKALASTARKTEYGFITKYENKTIIGQIDLIFEADDCVYIIDYKTDKIEIPENHKEQLCIYKKAVVDLYKMQGKQNLPVKTFLFYLRTGNAIQI